jgi:uncharacterized membrane protein
MYAELIVLRVVHVLSGIFWLGSGLFSALFLMPSLGKLGPGAGPFMAELGRRRMPTVLMASALLTILSGVRLLQLASGGFSGAYFATGVGRTFAGAGVLAVIGWLVAILIARPAAMRAGALGAAAAAEGDAAARGRLLGQLDGLRRRAALGNVTAVGLLVLAAAGMAVARYVR